MPSFDAIVCWKLDRLGRSFKHLVTTIEDLSAYGVAFISLRDNLDLSTPSGRLMMHIIGAMAQFEGELIKERVSAGMHAARKRGSKDRPAADVCQFRSDPGVTCAGCSLARNREAIGHRHRYGRASGPVTPLMWSKYSQVRIDSVREKLTEAFRASSRVSGARLVPFPDAPVRA
jgi:hypothetical protein